MTTARTEAAAAAALLTTGDDPWALVRSMLGEAVGALLILLGARPWPEQLTVLANLTRFTIITGGQQGGKSWLMAVAFVIRYFRDLALHPDVPTADRIYWVTALEHEDYAAEKHYLEGWFKTLGLLTDKGKASRENLWTLTDGTRIRFKVVKSEKKVNKESPLGILVCEAAKVPKRSFDEMMIRAEQRDGWLLAGGTFEGNIQPWYTTTFIEWMNGLRPECSAFSLPSYANRTLYKGGKDDPKVQRIRERTTDALYMERIEGRPVPSQFRIFQEINPEIHIHRETPAQQREVVSPLYLPEEPVFVMEDPGFHGHAIYGTQFYADTLWVFDEMYELHRTPSMMIRMAKMRRWWTNEAKTVITDPNASNTRFTGQERTIREIWLEEAGLVPVPNTRFHVLEGIARIHDFLAINPATGRPFMVISQRAVGLLSELGIGGSPLYGGEYRPWVFLEAPNGEPDFNRPSKFHCEGLKALYYGLVWLFGLSAYRYRFPDRADAVSTIDSRGGFREESSGPLQPDAVWQDWRQVM